MTVRPDRRRRLLPLLGAATAVVLFAGACTTSDPDGAAAPVTVTSRVEAPAGADDPVVEEPAAQQTVPTRTPEAPGSIVVVDPGDEPAAQSSGSTVSTSAPATTTPKSTAPRSSTAKSTTKSTTTKSTATKTTPKPKPKPKPQPARIVSTPRNGAADVDPIGRISVTAAGGKILWVKLINPEGKVVKLSAVRGKHWTWMPELGFGRKYQMLTATQTSAGLIKTYQSSFTTLRAKKQVSATVFPSNGKLVGVGQPIVITFSAPIKDNYRRAVEKMITIERTAAQPGSFRWFSDTEVHWRPKGYWKAGSAVRVRTEIYGAELSPGLYGAADGNEAFKVGRRVTSIVNAATHTMDVYQDFKLIKSIPVSLGNDKYPTYNGIHVVTEKHAAYTMDSSTWGLTGAGAYRTKVKWATRISNSGEFVHGAPWSEYAQGNSNVSHGCINMTDASAQWYLKKSLPGDVLIVKNSVGPTIKSYDGYGDWNIPFAKY